MSLPPDALAALEGRLGYAFADRDLLARALTHSSLARRSNQQLEFLGDRVLGLVIAEDLYRRFPDEPEGRLARMLNAMVRAQTCAEVGLALGLDEALKASPSLARRQAELSDSVLGDACEAVIAAIYLDGGLAAARAFVDRHWRDRLADTGAAGKDAKSTLQEWAAARQLAAPIYTVTDHSGPDHAPSFTVEVAVPGLAPALGEGASKRAAEQQAAAAALRSAGLWP